MFYFLYNVIKNITKYIIYNINFIKIQNIIKIVYISKIVFNYKQSTCFC